MKITDTMVLALLKKGFGYEIENMDVEFETEIPMSAFPVEETKETVKIKMNCKVKGMKITINEEVNEF